MKSGLPILAVLAGLGSSFSFSAAAQLVVSHPCDDERQRPNLHIAEAANVSGVVTDATGTALPEIVLQIQNPHNTWVLKSVAANDRGEFDFGRIPPGEFRLVPVRVANGKASRLSGYDAPLDLTCDDSKPCELRVRLPFHPADQPYQDCPPR
jgi:hypothetical protein